MTEVTTMQSPYSLRKIIRRFRRRRSTITTSPTLIEKSETKCDSAIHILETPPASSNISAALPTTQRALLIESKGTYNLHGSHPLPQCLSYTDIMIKPHAVGLNPIDWKSVSYNFCLPSFPWITGREAAGTVVNVHPSVTHIKEGDRVWTSTYYRDVRAGCFQEYVVVPQHTVLKIPDHIGYEEAACLGVPGLTAAMTLWKWLEIGWPPSSLPAGTPNTDREDNWLLIWGGSAVTGQFATQLAVHSGWKVITVTSERTKPLSLSLGATHVVSRDGKSDQEIVDEIRHTTNGCITKAIDLVGPKTAKLVLQSVSKAERVDFAPLAMIANDEVTPDNVTVHTVEMKQFVLDPECKVYAEAFNELVAQGKVTFPDMHILEGGLEQVVPGLEMLKRGHMGGKKLIVRC